MAAASIHLTDAEVADIGGLVSPDQIWGERYPESMAQQAGR